ncbi:Fmp32p [Sugiyamaella lignohabitans]|uniref:Fmp32p n=1 Tax=Sugiyamaella lignohabitans TaxID=796027 RepID=A0A167E559_9ASCO|nr:Fmp32p [Sugiyamaella lignohabitans]ANB13652.1 Fmp32p [Sugiyamaella lignohabitans]
MLARNRLFVNRAGSAIPEGFQRRLLNNGNLRLKLGQYHFDTRKFALQLEQQGFTQTQSEAVLKALASVLDDSVEHLSANLVSKEEFSRRVYQQKVDFTKLKSELQTLDKTEVTRVTNEHERLMSDLEKVRQKFKEQIAKSRANVRLDLNLEKGRIREESAIHELKIKETDTRIDQELANFKTQIEGTKVQVAQWLIGVCTGTFAIVLAYMRLIA